MARRAQKECRDGAPVKAKFELPPGRLLVVSFAKKIAISAETIVELYGCQGWVRHGDFSNIVCQNGKAVSCTTPDGTLEIKAQGPQGWNDQGDIKTLKEAVVSGLQEAASAGAERVCLRLKFSLGISGNDSLKDGTPFSVAHALAILLSNQRPTGIKEVNVCIDPSYAKDDGDCTKFIKECSEQVLSGRLLLHTGDLPQYESVVAKNKMLNEEVIGLRKEIDELRKEMEQLKTEAQDTPRDPQRRSHHQRLRAKQQREKIPRTPEVFSD